MRRRELLELLGSAALLAGCGEEDATPPRAPAVEEAPPPPPVERRSEPVPETRPATDADWARLAERLEGEVVRPDAERYAVARRLFDPRFDSLEPQGVAYCRSESDVQRSVAFARAHALPFAARCGGHSYGGYSSGEGLVCDVGPMSAVALDGSGAMASVGAGAKLIDIYAQLAARSLVIPGGTCPSVGISGLTLGGGQGVFGRKLGLTCDAVDAMRIVTADGVIHACDAETDADLFWASRGGGGGNFGVVTQFRFRTHHVPRITRFALPWRWGAAADVVAGWQEWGPDAPREIWSKCELGSRGADRSVAIHGVFPGDASSLAPHLDALIARVGSAPRRRRVESAALLDTMLVLGGCARRTYEECHMPPEGTLGRGMKRTRSHVVQTSLSPGGIETLLEGLDRSGLAEGSGRVGLDAVGGAINAVDPDATAFVHRRARFIAQYATYWSRRSNAAEASERWLDQLYAAMQPHAGGAYGNYIDPRLSDWERAYYGANLPRLRAIKRRHDPDDFFRFAQSIRG
ncbi:MAG: FAD-binding oxidoreductase [Sandaracinaceae bacterium]